MGCTHSCGKQSVTPTERLKNTPSTTIEQQPTGPSRRPSSSVGFRQYFDSPDNSYDLPREELTGFSCPSGHSLFRAEENLYTNNRYTCDLCGLNKVAEIDPSGHCDNCRFDICPKCLNDQPDIHYACISGHRLFRVTNIPTFKGEEGHGANNYTCNLCGKHFEASNDPTYNCSHCEFDICHTCFRSEQIRSRKCPVGHYLFRVRDLPKFHKGMAFYNNDYTCNLCRRTLQADQYPTCHCPACLFDICPDCMVR